MDAPPFFMNLLKHHALYLKSLTKEWAKQKVLPDSRSMNRIGGSQMDLYMGKLAPNEIFQELSTALQELKINNRQDFIRWLSPKGYHSLICSDGSKWILKLKKDNPDHYIHLHPARYSPHSVRIKATTLKATLLAATFFRLHRKFAKKEEINQLRQEYLFLSPVPNPQLPQEVLLFLVS